MFGEMLTLVRGLEGSVGAGKRRAPLADPLDRAMADEIDAEADDLLASPTTGARSAVDDAVRRSGGLDGVVYARRAGDLSLGGGAVPRAGSTGRRAAIEGHVASTKGDGLLAVFGHPTAHEDDAQRAVSAGWRSSGRWPASAMQAVRRFGFESQVRVGVHRGLVYLDTAQDDVYGLAPTWPPEFRASRQPGTVVVSEAIEPLVRGLSSWSPARPPR